MTLAGFLDALDIVRAFVYGALVVAAFFHWRHRPGRASAWLVTTFSVLAFPLILGELLPEDPEGSAVQFAQRASIATLVLFPYCLYRFMASLIRPVLWFRTAATIIAVLVAVGPMVIPDLGDDGSDWVQIYLGVVLIQWVLLSGIVAVRLWRSGRAQPAVARRRMRTMSAGASGLALAIVVTVEFSTGSLADLLVELLVLGAAPMMLVGFAPPYVLRVLWRRREDVALKNAGLALMQATTTSQVAATLLPHARSLVGASAAVLENADGDIVASEGLGPQDALDAPEAPADPSPERDGALVRVPMTFGQLTVLTNPLAPFFGSDEMTRLHELAALADLALARIRLLEDQRRLAAIVESSEDAIIAKTLEGTITSWNRGAEALYGYTSQEVRGRPISILVPPDFEDDVPKILEAVGRGESMGHYETKRRRKDGEVIDVSLTVSPITGSDGNVVAASVIARDVTERKKMEQQLRRNEAQLAAAQRTGQIGSWSWDAASDRLTWSEELYRIFDMSPVEVDSADAFLERVHPDDRTRVEEASAQVLTSQDPLLIEYRVVRRDGSERVVEGRGTVTHEQGTPVSMTGTVQDVTERKRAEEETFRQQQLLSAIFDTSPDIIATISSRLELRYVNPAARQILGYEFGELFAEHSLHWVHPDDVNIATELIRDAFGGRGPQQGRIRAKTGTGDSLWLDIRMQRMTSGSDTAVVMARDVTAQVRLEEGLRQAREEADQASVAKSTFLSRMSHELRTPLNAVLGFTQLLELDHLSSDQRESTEEILKAGRHLLDLVNEVLDISRIEAGKLRLSLEAVDAIQTVEESISLLTPAAEQEGVTLDLDGSRGDRATILVTADRQRLKQVMLNLLSNAIKYNRERGNVRVAFVPVSDHRVRIDVTDTGNGIPEESMGRLFVPFERLGAEGSGAEGTGLGLALSKPLVEAMGGTLSVSSRMGEGSTFSVDLALTEDESSSDEEEWGPPDELEAVPDSYPSRTILYIEDNLSNLRLVERMVARRSGIHLVSAMQGSMGVALARDHGPDLILLDLDLPDIPGEEVLARLFSDPRTATLPVVVLTADATTGQAKRLLDAGARDYLTKPLDLPRFYELLDTFCGAP